MATLDADIPFRALAGLQKVQPYDPIAVQTDIDRQQVYQAQAQKAQQEMQAQAKLQQLAQQYGNDPDELVKQLGSVDPMLAQKLGEQIGQARYAGAQAHLEQSKAGEAEMDSWIRLLQGTDEKTWGPVLGAAVSKLPQLKGVISEDYAQGKQQALALSMSGKDWAKTQAEASQLYLDDKKQESAARLIAGADTPQKRQIADGLLKQAGLGQFSQMWASPQEAQAFLTAQQKAAPEKGGQHIEGIYQGKRTFGVFDPNTNTFNVDGKQVSASQFRPIPPQSAGGGGGGTGGVAGLTTGPGGGLESLATQYRLTKRFPVGVARTISKQDANAAINLAAEQDKLLGRSAAASIQKAAMFQANTAAAKQMAVLGAGTEAAESKALGQIDIIKELSPKVWRTQSTTINNWLVNPTQQFTGNKDAQSLANAILTFSSEYAKIINGSVGSVAGASDSARNDAAKLISNALSHGNLVQQLDLMRREMALTRVGYDVAQQHIADQMQGPQIPGSGPVQAPTATAAPAPSLRWDPVKKTWIK